MTAAICEEVRVQNVYRVPDQFAAGDVVMDLGAHVGHFAALCLERGAGWICCLEPHPDHYRRLRERFRDERRVGVLPYAAWRSDQKPKELSMTCSVAKVDTMAARGARGMMVRTRPLDPLLRWLKQVRFLKLDIEGAEFPVLYTSKELGRVQEIALEYHLPPELVLRAEGVTSYPQTAEALAAYLEAQGFTVETQAHSECAALGMLWGRR